MKVEELLKPRYKVIADWPENHFYEVGEIIQMALRPDGKTWWNGQQDYYLSDTSIELYPHLFKKLEWWEEREEKDMPEYVKIPHFPNGENDFIIERVDGYFIKHNFTDIGYFGIKYKDAGGVFYSNIYPATKQDYEAQNKKINTSI